MGRIDKPWGYEEILVQTSRYVLKKIFIKRGCRLSYQYHNKKDETIFVLEGELILNLDDSYMTGRMGFCKRIRSKKKHRFIASMKGDCVLLECSTPELDDVVRLHDDYGRDCGEW